MSKTKTLEEHLEIAPPVAECISAKYMIKLPVTDKHFNDSGSLNTYAEHILEKKLGDDVDLRSLKVRKPGLSARTWAKLLKKTPSAKLYVRVDF